MQENPKYETLTKFIISVFLAAYNPLHIAVIQRKNAINRKNGGVGAVSYTGNSNILGIGLDSPIPNIKRTYG